MKLTSEKCQTAQINSEKCVGCGACIPVCPVGAIRMMPGWVSHVDTFKCIGCGKCVLLCHKHAPHLSEQSPIDSF